MRYFVRSFDGVTEKGLYRADRYRVRRFDPNKKRWVVSRLTPPELDGLGGSMDFIEISKKRMQELVSTFEVEFEIVKRSEPEHRIFGWANTALDESGQTLLDRQQHMIEVKDLEEGAYRFVMREQRSSGDMHVSGSFGDLIESAIVTQEKVDAGVFPAEHLGKWWVGFELPPEEWSKVQSGERKMFSIQGKGRLEPVD